MSPRRPNPEFDRVRSELERLGVTPKRWKGQNFLLDTNVVRAAVAAAEVRENDPVLEVGPGMGILTAELLRTGAQVTAIELERRFAEYLRHRFRGAPNLMLLHANLFDVNLGEHFQDLQYTVVANLPYSATGLALRNFLSVAPRPKRAVLMLQREVVRRLESKPGEGSVLGVLAQAVAEVRTVVSVPPDAFWPPPEVHSAVVRIDVLSTSTEDRFGVSLEHLLRTARIGFAARRKTLANNLASGLSVPRMEAESILTSIGVSVAKRGQELEVSEWAELAKILVEKYFDFRSKK